MGRVSVRRENAAKNSSSLSPAIPQHRGSRRSLTATVPPIVSDVLRSSGQPLDAVTRGYMEPRFGHDFSKVRVHADAKAAEAAAAISARAFTSNRSVVFGSGEYAPHTPVGCLLLSHELTHVVQQRSDARLRKGVGLVDDEHEKHADNVARSIHAGQSARPLLNAFDVAGSGLANGVVVQRQEAEHGPDKWYTTAADATYVVGHSPNEVENWLKSTSKPQDAEGLFSKFLAKLDAWDKAMQGDATQSVGWLLWGMGSTSKGSTAAKPSKNAVYLNSSGGDMKELFEIFDLLLLTMADKVPGDVKKSLEAKKEEMFTSLEKLKNEPAAVIYDVSEKVKSIKEAGEEERKREMADQERKKRARELLQQLRTLAQETRISAKPISDRPPSVGMVKQAASRDHEKVVSKGRNPASKQQPVKDNKKTTSTAPVAKGSFDPYDCVLQEWISGDELEPGGQPVVHSGRS